jgi:hypothetical protein
MRPSAALTSSIICTAAANILVYRYISTPLHTSFLAAALVLSARLRSCSRFVRLALSLRKFVRLALSLREFVRMALSLRRMLPPMCSSAPTLLHTLRMLIASRRFSQRGILRALLVLFCFDFFYYSARHMASAAGVRQRGHAEPGPGVETEFTCFTGALLVHKYTY